MPYVRKLGWLAAAGILALLPACAGESSSGETDSGGAVHSVSGVLGGTVEGVPDDPERVVSLWNTGTQLLELGITPVGVLEDDLTQDRVDPRTWERVRDIPTVGTFDDLNVEKILSLEPDLIVGLSNGFMTEKDLKPFHEVGIPTLIWEIAEPPDVWTNYPKLATALGKRTDYDRRNARLDKELARLKQDFAGKLAGTTWANVRGGVNTGSFYVDTDQSLVSERLQAAGVSLPGFLTDLGEDARYAEELSYERIPDLAEADAILYEAEADRSPTQPTAELLEQPLWKQLPAAKAGNVFPIRQQFDYTFAGAHQLLADIRTAFEKFTPPEHEAS